MNLPALPALNTVHNRLAQIFPDGTPRRSYCIRMTAARTVFAMLYIGAVEDAGRWLAPKQVYRMSDQQAFATSDEDRLAYSRESMRPGYTTQGSRWYADNTREPIRDETLKDGLIPLGAVIVREGLPTTSNKGRYALQAAFARLFDPDLTGATLDKAIGEWQRAHLSPSALARIQILHRGAVATESGILVTFPNGETRRMAAGPSSVIAKAVIEVFAPRFLQQPGVIFLSESRHHVVARDDALAQAIGLKIQADRHLPDIILVDLGPPQPLLVFVEVVATDGPVTPERQSALRKLATNAGFDLVQVAFVTAYQDRSRAAFRKTVSALAWNTYAWFAAEPERLLILYEPPPGSPRWLYEL